MRNKVMAFVVSAASLLVLSACVLTAQTPTPAPTTPASTALPPTATTLPTATRQPTVQATTDTGKPVTLLVIQMVDEQTGWATGEYLPETLQRVLRTSDGGLTWTDVTPPDQAGKPAPLDTSVLAAFSGGEHAWAIYFSAVPAASSEAYFVWRTADGGQTWEGGQPLNLDNMTMEFFLPGDMGFSDLQNGWLMASLGGGMNHHYVAIYRTGDSGETWTRVVDPARSDMVENTVPMICSKNGVTFQDANNGWVSGNCNGVVAGLFLYRTQDGGQTWGQVLMPDPPSQQGILASPDKNCNPSVPIFLSATQGVMDVGCYDFQVGQAYHWLYRTSDGGVTWSADPAPTHYGNLVVAEDGRVWVLGYNDRSGEEPRTLYASPDLGQTWEKVEDRVLWAGQMSFVDELHGWAVAQRGEKPVFMRTTDGGKTWTEISAVAR